MNEGSKFVVTNKGVLKEYHGDDEVLAIPDGVKVIGSDIIGYSKGKHVRTVVIPEGVTEIRERAFSESEIAEIRLPKSIKAIGEQAFSGCKNLKSITIPDGVKVITNSMFWFSGLEEITLPDSVIKIGDDAFSGCYALKKINLPHIESLEIGPRAFTGCDSLVDDNGLLILQDRLFTYYSKEKDAYVVIPDNVKRIEPGAFMGYYHGPIHLEMSVNCPSWEHSGAAKVYGFATSLLYSSGSSITFRDAEGKKIAYVILANNDETEPKRNGAVLSIKSIDGKFDFAGYDEYFASLAKAPNKARVAMARVEYPYELSAEMLEVYRSYLKKQAVTAGTILIDEDRIETLEMLGEKQLLPSNAVKKLLEYAEANKKPAFSAWLLDYNNKTFGGKDAAKSEMSLGSMKKKTADTTQCGKTLADWRELYKFKYRDGNIVITGYRGAEEIIKIPEMMGDKYVVGIGKFAFERINLTEKTVKKIIVPGTVSSIESGAFYLVEDTEIEIQEGVTNIEKDAFFVVAELLITLPQSVSNIGEQFGDSLDETIRLIVPKGSYAEQFCADHKYKYTSIDAAPVEKSITSKPKSKKPDKPVNAWKKPKAGTHLISRYQGENTEVIYPDEVEGVSISGIANTAGETPSNYKTITSIVIPEGYSYIGNKAFDGCVNLETVVLPSTLKEIGTKAFADCKKLKEIFLRSGVTISGNDVFSGADIGTVIIETNTKIPRHLFYNCHIKNLVVVGGPFKSNSNVFNYRGGFPDAVYINHDFTTLDINGDDVRKIHRLADFDESNILSAEAKSLIAEEKKKSKSAVNNAAKALETEGVDHIDFTSSTFVLSNFDYLEEWDIQAAIEQRGGTVKGDVSSSVNYLVVPDHSMVKNSQVKKAIALQEKGKKIDIIKLEECRRHMRLFDEAVFGIEGAKVAAEYKLSNDNGRIILNQYQGNDVNVIVPGMVGDFPVVALGKGCFNESHNTGHTIKSVVIPESISAIPEEAFAYCEHLTSVTLPKGLLSIGRDAFQGCTSLLEIAIPESVTTIEYGAFQGCEKIKKIYIPANVNSIKMPFSRCEELTEIKVDDMNKVYDSRENCNAIIETETNTLIAGCKASTIPPTVAVIGDSAFCSFDAIVDFVVPEGVKEIGNNAFHSCYNLKSIKLPDSLVKIGYYAFYWCRALSRLELPANVTEVHASAFEHCDELAELVVNDKLREIQELNNVYYWKIKTIIGSKNSIAKAVAKTRRCNYVERK